MSKIRPKSKNKSILVLVFVVLLIAVVITQINKSKKGERSFDPELMSFDVEEVVSMQLYTKSNNFEPFSIVKNGEEWTIEQNDQVYPADPDLISSMVNELSTLEAKQVVAKKKDRWAEFDVTDTSGVRVVVNSDKKVIGDLFIASHLIKRQDSQRPMSDLMKKMTSMRLRGI